MAKIILTYHSIGKENLFLQVPEAVFRKQIQYILCFASPRTLTTFFEDKTRKPQNEVLIMFDDAFKDALPAMHYLEKQGIPFVVAVVDSFLEDEKYCSVNDLLELTNAEFVFHTKNHKPLTSMQFDELKREIIPFYANVLPLNHTVLVYPQGLYNKDVITTMKATGYVWGLTCLPFHLGRNYRIDCYEIPRLNINGFLSFWKFKFFLSGFGNIYLHVAFIKRKLLGENYLDK